MRRVLGLDFGRRWVGIAISDPLGLTAQPLETVARSDAIARVIELLAEYEVEKLVVGRPAPLSGGDSQASDAALSFGAELAEATGLEVVYVDERFTTKMANEAMLRSGLKRRDRRSKVDKVAAAIILQSYLDGNLRKAGDVGDNGANDT